MATARDRSDHDPGDEDDWRYCYVHDGNCEEQCPFCGELLKLSRAWCVPVLTEERFTRQSFEAAALDNSPSYYETITLCDRGACRDKAKALARRLGIPANERAVRRRHDYYMKTGERIR
jgi:hypothetical protein